MMSRAHFSTGKADVKNILGGGGIYGRKTIERRIILCEGEVKGRRVGEDSKLLRMAVEGSDWEIHNCGSGMRPCGFSTP